MAPHSHDPSAVVWVAPHARQWSPRINSQLTHHERRDKVFWGRIPLEILCGTTQPLHTISLSAISQEKIIRSPALGKVRHYRPVPRDPHFLRMPGSSGGSAWCRGECARVEPCLREIAKCRSGNQWRALRGSNWVREPWRCDRDDLTLTWLRDIPSIVHMKARPNCQAEKNPDTPARVRRPGRFAFPSSCVHNTPAQANRIP